MTSYHSFIGIDIGKLSFTVYSDGEKSLKEFHNNQDGMALFLKTYTKTTLKKSLCILETTGGYEWSLLSFLHAHKIPVHRANTRKVKHFIRSYGNAAKTDALDAKALAKYGLQRAGDLELFQPKSPLAMELYQLSARRSDLKAMLIAEKNRLLSPTHDFIISSVEEIISILEQKIASLTDRIQKLVNRDPELKAKQKVMQSIPGIGPIVSSELLILVPELGTLSRRHIASLVGLAPISRDSGQYKGYRKTGHGRGGVKPLLFMAAMAATNAHSNLKVFYENLVKRGKKKMVALTALMRKIIVIANAKIRDFMEKKTSPET